MWGYTAHFWASSNGHVDIAELLLDHGFVIDAVTALDSTPLMMSCREGHSSITKLLLDRGCKVNVVGEEFGDTALHYACYNGFTKGVKELIAQGANASIRSDNGRTPLDVARREGQQAIVASSWTRTLAEKEK